MIQRSCEDPSVVYLTLFRWRFIFRDGKYVGWYNTKLKKPV